MSDERLSILGLDLLDLASDDIESTDLLIEMLQRLDLESWPPEGEENPGAVVHSSLVKLVPRGFARSYCVKSVWNEDAGQNIDRLLPGSFEELRAKDDGGNEYWWEPIAEGRAPVEQQLDWD